MEDHDVVLTYGNVVCSVNGGASIIAHLAEAEERLWMKMWKLSLPLIVEVEGLYRMLQLKSLFCHQVVQLLWD
jgi:hypothetical protein